MIPIPALSRLALCGLVLHAVACSEVTPAQPPVVLIVVDTLRGDRLAAPHATRVTPKTSEWAAQGRRFEHAFAPSPWTLPSFASLYTGRIPSRHGAGLGGTDTPNGRFTRLRNDIPTLAERLQTAGYRTGAIIGNAALAPEFGMSRGFAHYDYAPATNAFTRRADVVVDLALAWIDDQGDAPYFLVVHLFDPHMNYDAPPPFRGRFTAPLETGETLPVTQARALRLDPTAVAPAKRRFIEAAYDEEVAFTDQEVARLLAALSSRGVLDEGLVVLTSDHGEEFFEHDGFEHGHAMWQEVVALPMIVWGNEIVPGVDATPVSLVDLAPTVDSLAGLPTPQGGDGQSLWPLLRAEAPLTPRTLLIEAMLYGVEQKAAIRWPYKLVWSPSTSSETLYDLARDSHESNPIPNSATAQALRKTAEAQFESRDGIPVNLDPETLRALRELGYAQPAED